MNKVEQEGSPYFLERRATDSPGLAAIIAAYNAGSADEQAQFHRRVDCGASMVCASMFEPVALARLPEMLREIHDGLVEAARCGLLPQEVPLLFDKAREAVAEAVRRRPREW
jgi:hypothetical protein